MALLVWPDQEPDQPLIAPLRTPGSKPESRFTVVPDLQGGQTDSPAFSSVPPTATATTAVCPVTHELDWCRPFLCSGTVEIAGNTYPVTVLRDTGAQQSVCRNVTGRKVVSSEAVLCRGLNTVEEFGTAEVKLSCPLVTAEARVAVADDLPVAGVDFLLGNDLAGGRVWVPTPSGDVDCSEGGDVPEDEVSVTQLQAGRGATDGVSSRVVDHAVAASTRGAVCRASGPPLDECSGFKDRVSRGLASIPEESVTQSKVVGALDDVGVSGARTTRATQPPTEVEVQTLPTAGVGISEELEVMAPDTINVVTRSQASKVTESRMIPCAVYKASESPAGERGARKVRRKRRSPVSRAVGADGTSAEPPIFAPDSVEVVAEGEEGLSSLRSLFEGASHPSGHPEGGTQVGVPPGMGQLGVSGMSMPRPGVVGSQLEVASAGGETSISAGEVEVSPPVEGLGGRGYAGALPGDCQARVSDRGNSPNGADGTGRHVAAPRLLRRSGLRAAALPQPHDPAVPPYLTHVTPAELISSQHADPDLAPLFARVGEGSEEPEGCEEFVLHQGVLCRKWQESDGGEFLQVVVPRPLRKALMLLAHAGPMAGHLGVRKTVARLRPNFWWPCMHGEVATFIKSCHTCQVIGKPTHNPPPAPLHPIPAVDSPFTRVLIDIVGPLPTTRSGHKYLLTLMDATTRYPEAVPLRSFNAKFVVKALLKFFTHFGLPAEIQSDQGTNFTSKLFADTMTEWGIKHITSSAYHPQSQGALERHHQTLKNMLRAFCYEQEKDWDEAVPYVLFAAREAPTESLGFSPNQLVFGHRVRGPLDVVREAWCYPQAGRSESLLQGVLSSRARLAKALELAREHLGGAQARMKGYYDRKATYREFAPGDEVLVLLPLQGQPLAARYSGPYVVERRVGDLDYMVATPDRRKRAQLCHVNMLKPYIRSKDQEGHLSLAKEAAPLVLFYRREGEAPEVRGPDPVDPTGQWESNSLGLLRGRLKHLPVARQEELFGRLSQYPAVFGNAPGLTHLISHDIDVGEAQPVKLPPYRVNPQKQLLVEKELEYMLQHGLIKRTYSQWSSPITLQPKPNGKVRFCIDFRKVNSLTRADTYPLPRVDDSVDRIGAATFITKVDLVKGYWQVPLTERAKEIASFVANGAVYQCQVMPYGLRNAPATFQRLMDRVTDGLTHCVVYIDDVVIYDTTWEEHLTNVDALFARLHDAGLVVNLEKCEFVQARVQYLGYLVGHGYVTPPEAKVEAIRRFPAPTCRRALQRFLGVVGYYRRFVPGYSTILAPLTDLLQKGKKWHWSEACSSAFTCVKAALCEIPVLRAPDFSRPFALAVDASQVGVGAVLMQPDDDNINHPVCYFSKKFSPAQRNYSVVEQELLAIVLALQHFEVYTPSFGPKITIFSDHSPLQFLAKFKFKNLRLTRWSLLLQEYNLEVKHIKGADNVVADCLSRAEPESNDE